jgi:hypothetical protein
MYIRRKVFSVALDENGEERLFSTTKKDSVDNYEGLNYSDLIANVKDKNPLTIKKLRKARREHLSKEKGKGKLSSKIRGGITGAVGAVHGGIIGHALGGKSGAALGAMGGAAAGTAAGYFGDRGARALRNKIRKSGGGGTYDDYYARKADRLAMLDGEMSKDEFKKKWYRHNQAR